MKAKYILEAMEAMKAAEAHLNTFPKDPNDYQRESWKIYDDLGDARRRLEVYSGIEDMEIEVEKA